MIKDFLQKHLPELIHVVSGQIVDAEGCYSRQQDVVLMLKSIPRLNFSSKTELIFSEGVVATIEIKSRLNTETFKKACENIASVNKLKASIGASAQLGISHSWPSNRILNVIISYEGMSHSGLSKALSSIEESGRPDLILILSQGLWVRNHGLLLPRTEDYEHIICDNPAVGFMFFLTFLTEITGTISSRGVQWRNYWGLQ